MVRICEDDALNCFNSRTGNFDIFRLSDNSPLRDFVTVFQTSPARTKNPDRAALTNTVERADDDDENYIDSDDDHNIADSHSSDKKRKGFSFDEICQLAIMLKTFPRKLTKTGSQYKWAQMCKEVYHITINSLIKLISLIY